MTDLEAFRDHARRMADWEPPTRPECMSDTCYHGHIYGACHRTPSGCACSCHDVLGPTPAERALWRHLADEVDEWLARETDDEQEPDGLWEDA